MSSHFSTVYVNLYKLFICVCFICLFTVQFICVINLLIICAPIYFVNECSSISTFKNSSEKFWKRTSRIEI